MDLIDNTYKSFSMVAVFHSTHHASAVKLVGHKKKLELLAAVAGRTRACYCDVPFTDQFSKQVRPNRITDNVL